MTLDQRECDGFYNPIISPTKTMFDLKNKTKGNYFRPAIDLENIFPMAIDDWSAAADGCLFAFELSAVSLSFIN